MGRQMDNGKTICPQSFDTGHKNMTSDFREEGFQRILLSPLSAKTPFSLSPPPPPPPNTHTHTHTHTQLAMHVFLADQNSVNTF